MAKIDTLWTCIGITTHKGQTTGAERTTVRYGTDKFKRIASTRSQTYITIRGELTTHTRNDFIDLPTPMLKIDALKYALASPEFQSLLDQELLQEEIHKRTPREVKVRVKHVKQERKNITAEQLISVLSSEQFIEETL
jgi:hypothetical protein